MYTLKPLPEFTRWLSSLQDRAIQGLLLARLKRLELGLMGDVEPVGNGISELRIHTGAGWRIYFTQRGNQIIVLLIGGTKKSQTQDIKTAKKLASTLT